MTQLTIRTKDGIPTMSSLDMVAYINASREEGQAELLHKSFLTKVPKVLGITSAKFLAHVALPGPNGATRQSPCYFFPEEESMLLAMSYSYALQRQVYRSWKEAEAQLVGTAKEALPTTYLDALKQLVTSVEHSEKQAIQITQQAAVIEQAAPKVAFHDAVAASDAVYTIGDAAKLLGVGPNWFFAWLRGSRYLMENNVPYASAAKYIESALGCYEYEPGKFSPPKSYVTAAGLIYFEAKLRKQGKIA